MQENSSVEIQNGNDGIESGGEPDASKLTMDLKENKVMMQDDKPCGCGSNKSNVQKGSFVYAIGRIQPRFPSRSAEKEYYQAMGRTETSGQTDYEAMHTALSQRQNRYLARQMCWVLTIEGIETYLLKPADPTDLDLLIESLRIHQDGNDRDVVIGYRGPFSSPEMCNGLVVPMVAFEHIYSFDVDTLMKALPKPKKSTGENYQTRSRDLFHRIMQMADNVGATDEHRCLNYLAVRYHHLYERTAEMHDNEFSLTEISVKPSRLRGVENILDCIFTYNNRKTDVNEKMYCRVSVSGLFPYLVTKFSPYYDR
jgi:hypothetical protein